MIGDREISRRAGVFAALLFTFSNYHLGFAQEARVYALFGLLTAASMYFFLAVVREPRRTWPFIALCTVNILLPYAHFFGWIVIFIQCCSLAFKNVRNGILLKYGISLGIVILAYTPYLPIFFGRTSQATGNGTWLVPSDLEGLYNMIWDWSNAPVMAVLFIAILVFSLAWHLIYRKKSSLGAGPTLPVLLLWFLIPFLGMFIISFKAPIFLDRYLIFVSIGFYLLLAALFEIFWKRKWIGWVLASSCILGMAFTFKIKKLDEERPRTIALEIKKLQRPERLTLISPKWYATNFSYHYDRRIFQDHEHLEARLNENNIRTISDSTGLTDLNEYNSVLYIDAWAELVDPERSVQSALKTHFHVEQQLEIKSKFKVYLYSMEP